MVVADPSITGAARSLFPEGVEVHERHLVWAEQMRVVEDYRRLLAIASQGIFSGLAVTLNGVDAKLLDITAGVGYTGWVNTGVRRGSVYAELAAGIVGTALADYTLGTVNIVSLVASDSNQDPEPHEDDGTVHFTKVDRTASLEILTEAGYNALSDAQKDLRLILARVTARGAGVDLQPSDVVVPVVFTDQLTTTQPVNITGVDITNCTPTTSTGTGTLTFTIGPTRLQWQAPGDGAGVAQTITTSGYYTLPSGTITKTISVYVMVGALPVAGASDSIVVSKLYDQTVSRLSGIDALHRKMVGTGLPTATNPHGLILADIGGDPEVIEARGTEPTLDSRLDVSLNEDGTLKPTAIAETINHNQLLDMPDTAVTPATAVADHDARYGDIAYTGGPSTRANPTGAIVADNETHRDAISRLSGTLSPLVVATDPVKGDTLVGHNFDATVAPGWVNAQVRSIINSMARLANTMNSNRLGIYYSVADLHVVVPPQVINCRGLIRWQDVPIPLNWTSYFDTAVARTAKHAYYVYLKPDASPATTYTPVISDGVNDPVLGAHPSHSDWVYVGSFITDDAALANVIPFSQANGIYTLQPGTGQTLDDKKKIFEWTAGLGTSKSPVALIDGTYYVVPKTARKVLLQYRSHCLFGGGSAANYTLWLGDANSAMTNAGGSGIDTADGAICIVQSNANLSAEQDHKSGEMVIPLDSAQQFYYRTLINTGSGVVKLRLMRNGWVEDVGIGNYN